MAVPLRVMMFAGEASGDRLGAALLEALKVKAEAAGRTLEVFGVGGAKLQEAGLESLVSLEDVAVMGVAEVLPRLPKLFMHMRTLVQAADVRRPEVLITIDSYEFSSLLARRVAKLPDGDKIVRVHYNPPKVWAWRQGRVKQLAGTFTQLLSILPFEGPWFAKAGVPCAYVGHPAVATLAPLRLPEGAPRAVCLALLPGSRVQEWRRHWPVMLMTYRRLRKLLPALSGRLVLPDEHAMQACRALGAWEADEKIEVVLGEGRFAALAECKAALAKSGTNTLELALLGVPAVVGYATSGLTYWLAKKLVKVPYVALPNLIVDFEGVRQPVYPEYLQEAFTPENLTRALYPLLTDNKTWARQREGLAEVQRRMAVPVPAAEAAAEVVWGALQARGAV